MTEQLTLVPPTLTKRCRGCGVEKSLTEYHFVRSGERAGKPLSQCRDCRRASQRASEARYPERVKRRRRRNYEKTRDERIEYNARYAARNPIKVRLWRVAQGFRKSGVPFTTAGFEYGEILLRDPCAYCGATPTGLDHIHPIRDGGDSDWENLTPACGSCNSAKGPRPLLISMLRRRSRNV